MVQGAEEKLTIPTTANIHRRLPNITMKTALTFVLVSFFFGMHLAYCRSEDFHSTDGRIVNRFPSGNYCLFGMETSDGSIRPFFLGLNDGPVGAFHWSVCQATDKEGRISPSVEVTIFRELNGEARTTFQKKQPVKDHTADFKFEINEYSYRVNQDGLASYSVQLKDDVRLRILLSADLNLIKQACNLGDETSYHWTALKVADTLASAK